MFMNFFLTPFIFDANMLINERFLLFGRFYMEKSIEEVITEETERRLKEMSAPDYQFPKKADRIDAAGIAIMVGLSAILILLCMMGVIV